MTKIPDDVLDDAERGHNQSMQLAHTLSEGLTMFEPAVVVNALSILMAAQLVATDGQSCIHEELGLGLLGDEERLKLFHDSTVEYAATMRAGRDAVGDKPKAN